MLAIGMVYLVRSTRTLQCVYIVYLLLYHRRCDRLLEHVCTMKQWRFVNQFRKIVHSFVCLSSKSQVLATSNKQKPQFYPMTRKSIFVPGLNEGWMWHVNNGPFSTGQIRLILKWRYRISCTYAHNLLNQRRF